MEQKKIQQQVFTRDREGVFRSSEGYDTVAKSPSLDGAFIKSALHPYCVYKPPQELLARGEENSELYPESLLAFHAENGDLVVGRSIYVETDFTGQRSASFTHQFIIPKQRKEAFLRDPRRLFGIHGFRSSYDIRDGKMIPELDELEFDNGQRQDELDHVLTKLSINKELFQQLIHVVMSSVANKKKVFISLNTNTTESADWAKRLLELLYSCLPYAVRGQLGFMTFNSEPEAKQHLHVVFVERGGIRLPDRRIEKDHLFDLSAGRFLNTELPGNLDPHYLDFVWKQRNQPEQLRALFDFCDEALTGTDTNTSYSLTTYSLLTLLYEIAQGDEALYEKDRIKVMNGILTYLSADTIQSKPRLNKLFISLLSREAGDPGSLLGADYIETVIRYDKLAESSVKPFLIKCLGMFVSRAAAGTTDNIEGAVPILDELSRHSALFSAVHEELLRKLPNTAESYLKVRMKRVVKVQSFMDEISFWLAHSEAFVTGEFFSQEAYNGIKRLLRTEMRKRISLAQSLMRFFDGISKSAQSVGKQAIQEFCRGMRLGICLELLDDMQPVTLSEEEIRSLGFLLDPVDPALYRHAGTKSQSVLRKLRPVYKVLTLDGDKQSEAEEEIDHLDPVDLDYVQQQLRKMLRTDMGSAGFGRIVTAFYSPGSGGAGSDYPSHYQYDAMLEYIAVHTKGTESLYDFLLWSAQDSRFQEEGGRRTIHPNYKASVIRVFDLHEPQAFKKKTVARRLLAVDNPSFLAMFQSVQLRQSSKLARMWAKNKRRIILRSSFLALLLILLVTFLWKPIAGWLTPPPVLIVEAIPDKTGIEILTLKASLQEANPDTELYVNDKLIGKNSIQSDVTLKEGENEFVFKAVNPAGKSSELVSKKVTLMPPPKLKADTLPDSVRTNSVLVAAKAEDENDPTPEIYVNGQLAGTGHISKSIQLNPGDNEIEIRAKNKYGRMSEPFKHIVKSTAAGTGTTAASKAR